MREFTAKFLGSCAGLGYIPVAPGTFTSLAAAAVFAAFPVLLEPQVAVPSILIITAVGIWASGVMEETCGHDPSEATIDEFSGQWLTLLLLPEGWVTVLLGFAAFRFFDILKPEPVNSAQKLPGGWGVMADDLVAGVYANLSVRIALWLFSLAPVSMPL